MLDDVSERAQAVDAATTDRWWPEIPAFLDSGHSNATEAAVLRAGPLLHECRATALR